MESLLRLGYPRDAVQADAACELLHQLDFRPETVLVADDVHLLPESGAGGGMTGLCTLLARRNQEQLRLVLISRDTWPGDRGGREMLALKGQLAAIDRDTLALNAGEIRTYYTLCGLPLGMEEAESLHGATGGWISALFLYLLHYGKHGRLARPTAVATLLEREVFLPLSEAARDLLPRLAPLERFSAEQADWLYGGDARGDSGGTAGQKRLHRL